MDDFLERRRKPIIGFLLIVIIVGLAALIVRWPRSSAGMGPLRALPVNTPVVRTVERQVKVHVAGAVQHPGLYAFRDGDRVDDAIKAAGGATADADLSRLNLAQRLRDEGYIFVPSIHDAPTPASGSAPAAAVAPSARLNINTASQAQLEALPGIGTVYAQRILDYRAKNGPFQKTSDLVTLKLIPQSAYDKLADLIDVK